MSKSLFRKLHRQIALIVLIPLFLTALTGVAYRIGRSWFGISNEMAEILMDIHQGSYLGSQLRPFYVLLNGLSVIVMIVTGFTMSNLFRKRNSQ